MHYLMSLPDGINTDEGDLAVEKREVSLAGENAVNMATVETVTNARYIISIVLCCVLCVVLSIFGGGALNEFHVLFLGWG